MSRRCFLESSASSPVNSASPAAASSNAASDDAESLRFDVADPDDDDDAAPAAAALTGSGDSGTTDAAEAGHSETEPPIVGTHAGSATSISIGKDSVLTTDKEGFSSSSAGAISMSVVLSSSSRLSSASSRSRGSSELAHSRLIFRSSAPARAYVLSSAPC